MTCKIWWFPVTGLALIWLAGPSTAGDGRGIDWDYKTIPGAACQPQTGAQAGDFERNPFSIRNASESATERTVICPIVRDTVNEYPLDVGVTVTTNVRCTFHITNFTGDQVDPVFEPSGTHSHGDGREIQFFGPTRPTNFDPEGFVGYYAIQCVLPPNGEVFSYIIGELTETTDHRE
jgi:hypothetical protein